MLPILDRREDAVARAALGSRGLREGQAPRVDPPIPRRDPVALAHSMEQALYDSETTAKRRSAARQRVEQELSFDRRMQAVEAIYERLMDESCVRNSRRMKR